MISSYDFSVNGSSVTVCFDKMFNDITYIISYKNPNFEIGQMFCEKVSIKFSSYKSFITIDLNNNSSGDIVFHILNFNTENTIEHLPACFILKRPEPKVGLDSAVVAMGLSKLLTGWTQTTNVEHQELSVSKSVLNELKNENISAVMTRKWKQQA
jgi:hypothetical protein